MAYQVATAATGVARDAHYAYAPTMAQFYRSLLLEPQRTNAWTYSEDLSDAAWTKTGCTVTTNATVAPDGAATMDAIVEDTGTSAHGIERSTGTFTANTRQAMSLFVKPQGRTFLQVRLTNGSDYFEVVVDFTLETATVANGGTASGAFSRLMPDLVNGGYRVTLSGIVNAASTTATMTAYWGTDSTTFSYLGTGIIAGYLWGFQFEANQGSSSSYIPTVATTVTRNADSCYFNFTTLPQEMTVYVRGVELQTPNVSSATYSGVVFIGGATETGDPRLGLYKNLTTGYTGFYDPGTGVSTTAIGTAATAGSLVELRLVLSSTWTVLLGASIDGGAESATAASAAAAASTAWNNTRLYLSSLGGAQIGSFAFTNVCVALGTQTRATMRGFAGVS